MNNRIEIIYILLFSKDLNKEIETDIKEYSKLEFRENIKGNVLVQGGKKEILNFLADRSDELFFNLLAFHKHKAFMGKSNLLRRQSKLPL
jgi:hypothetical protein